MVSNNAFTAFAECDLMLSIMRMESLLKCGIRSFSRYALNTSAAVPPEKVSTVQRSVHLNRWQDGRIFWLGRRNRINCSATAERISISSDHICIISAFVQKHKITYFEFRYTVWPVLPFFCYIEDAPVRWCEEISSYDDISATEENAKRYRCLPEDLMLL